MPREYPGSFPFFDIGELVESVPDTRPGIHPSQSVPMFGRLEEIKDPVGDGGFRYRISSIHHKQNMIWVEEYQIQRVSSSVFGNPEFAIQSSVSLAWRTSLASKASIRARRTK